MAKALLKFYKVLSNIYLKYVNNQRFNQSYHDTSFCYHRMEASVECLQGPSLCSGSAGACLQAIICAAEIPTGDIGTLQNELSNRIQGGREKG